jgi:hypothetical protein
MVGGCAEIKKNNADYSRGRRAVPRAGGGRAVTRSGAPVSLAFNLGTSDYSMTKR